MPKSLDTIASHVSNIIEGRQKTKEARFKKLPPGGEHVDDVLRQAVAYLAERLADKGFKPAYSRLSLSRRLGEITQTISIDRNGSNLSGVSVQISAHVVVAAASFGAWRESQGNWRGTKYLWARQLGYLSGRRDYLMWQLVAPTNREVELQHLLDSICTLALPAFDAWSSKQSISKAVLRFTEQDRIDWVMEAALWAGDRHAAAQALTRHLELHPKDVGEYIAQLNWLRENPTATPGIPISGAAFLVARHALDVAM
jgi:hypothetical protein